MSKDLDNLKKGTDAFYKKVNSHMKSIRNFDKDKNKRERNAINEWFYGKVKAQKPLGKEFEKVLFDNLWELYDDGK